MDTKRPSAIRQFIPRDEDTPWRGIGYGYDKVATTVAYNRLVGNESIREAASAQWRQSGTVDEEFLRSAILFPAEIAREAGGADIWSGEHESVLSEIVNPELVDWRAIRTEMNRAIIDSARNPYFFAVHTSYGDGIITAIRDGAARIELDIEFGGVYYHVLGYPTRDDDEIGVWGQVEPDHHVPLGDSERRTEYPLFVYRGHHYPSREYDDDGERIELRRMITEKLASDLNAAMEDHLDLFYQAGIHKVQRRMEAERQRNPFASQEYGETEVGILEAKRECLRRVGREGLKHAVDTYFSQRGGDMTF